MCYLLNPPPVLITDHRHVKRHRRAANGAPILQRHPIYPPAYGVQTLVRRNPFLLIQSKRLPYFIRNFLLIEP